MIARTVTNHKPDIVIKNVFFEQYIISKKINKKHKIFNIDDIEIDIINIINIINTINNGFYLLYLKIGLCSKSAWFDCCYCSWI